ncbi:Predicted metalloprotease, contains C-terminal PDZ domain [Parasphingorhabdus marina DSM 22363]|uniref:Predicted metalloprotease, contains C-terminal PDZ domain n=2 Tax=Parasphingorhabdus marina TaxID=394732 RepID=A0A1N6CNC9_9SPHN|nr:Predicted metalloprotease, contains C-terminal PDZ domain [Parasphingorhabdus marina DSM 22363]
MRVIAPLGLAAGLLFLSSISSPDAVHAEPAMPDNLSKPVWAAPDSTIPAPQDVPYPGTMRLSVDATDNKQGIFRVEQVIPVAKAGRLTLLYPEWLPGNHAPRGEIEKLAGLEFAANGQTLEWIRDDVDVYAFHVTVPEGVSEITARFQFVSATSPSHGRIVMAPSMLNLRWHQVSLYPAGHYVRQIAVEARAKYPDGWQAASAMRPNGEKEDGYVVYRKTDYDTLIDSPVFAGAHFRTFRLTRRTHLNVVADAGKFLRVKRSHLAAHTKLVREAQALFGSRPFDRYDFLLALTEEMGGIGIEHHRSSENAVNREYFTEWDKGPGRRNLLPHEVVHSWNGKFRRPAAMWTPDFRQPMRDSLLWVYEGQTQFWGYVLGARSGMYSKQDTLDAFAAIAANMDRRVGREWRPLIDTTHDPIIAARKPKPWSSWQRSEDYYNEGLLIWLEADGIIRRESDGTKSLDDFARQFFKGRNGDYGVVTYTEADVIAALQEVQPWDWESFVRERVYAVSNEAPKEGLTLGGYQLVYTDQQTPYIAANDKRRKQMDLSHSIGLVVSNKGVVTSVIWNSPAFRAGLKAGLSISAVNGKAYSAEALRLAVEENRDKPGPIEIFAKYDDQYSNFLVDYSGGLRYPHLQKIPGQDDRTEGGIDRLLKPKTR